MVPHLTKTHTETVLQSNHTVLKRHFASYSDKHEMALVIEYRYADKFDVISRLLRRMLMLSTLEKILSSLR